MLFNYLWYRGLLMSKKLSTEQFIEKAKLVHGDKYDYSVSEYIGYHNKIKTK